MKTIDTRGRLCPEPLIMTKRAISGAGPGDEFEVLTDNPTALSNLKSYLTELGIVFRTEGDTVRFVLAGVPSGAAAGTPDPVCGTPSRSVPVSGHGDYCVAVSDTVAALKELERRGVKILVCGTCLDFYDAKERLAVGTVSNMFKITEVLAGAGHVVYP